MIAQKQSKFMKPTYLFLTKQHNYNLDITMKMFQTKF